MTERLTQGFEPLIRHMNRMTEDAIREEFREAMDAFLNQDIYVERTTRRGGTTSRPRWNADTLIAWTERILRAPTKTILMSTITDFVLYLDGRAIRGETITHLDLPTARTPCEIVTALTVHGEPVGTEIHGADTLHVYIDANPPGQRVPAEQVVDTIKRFPSLTAKVFLLDDQRRKGLVSWVKPDQISIFYPEAGGYRVVQRSDLRRSLCQQQSSTNA